MARRCWKHSRQNTGRPCVGRKGTVVSFPHCEQLVLVSDRICEPPPPPPPPSARFALQALHRLGSFLNPLSAKNICSPAVKTNSAPHSAHFRILSWYSIGCSGTPRWLRGRTHPRKSQTCSSARSEDALGKPKGPIACFLQLVLLAPLLLAQALARKRLLGASLL